MSRVPPAGVRIIADQDPSAARPQAITRAREGDLDAYEEVYRDNVGTVFAICLRMTANRDRAEELTQQTFVTAWERLSTFRGDGQVAPWLARIAVNLVLSERRTSRRRREKQHEIGDVVGFRDTVRPAADGSKLDLERAVACLPPRARAVFVLHDVEGYRHQEIANMLDVTTGTSKAQLHRARRILREMLRP